MNKPIAKIDPGKMQGITDTLLAARKNNLKEVLEIAHRLETVGSLNEVTFINDSKSTNTNATLYSLECMTKPVVWLVSSSDWAQDYHQLTELVAKKVKAIVCIETEGEIPSFDFRSFGKECRKVTSLEKALVQANKWAQAGDVVLFSPAHPSELCYDSYKERGEHFRSLVNNLLKN